MSRNGNSGAWERCIVPLGIGLVIAIVIGIKIFFGQISINSGIAKSEAAMARVNAGTHYPARDAQRSGFVTENNDEHTIMFPKGSLTFSVEVPTSGQYYLASTLGDYDQYWYGGTDTANVSLNGQFVGILRLGLSSRNMGADCTDYPGCHGTAMKIYLQAGSNTITLSDERDASGSNDVNPYLLEIIVFS